MQAPSLPPNEDIRLDALRNLQILDTPAEERFDRLTRIAKHIMGSPIALISLVDTNRQWFKSKQGLDACETPRDISFCGHAILNHDIFYIPNALDDPRFNDNPLVTGPPNIRSYAGAPLKDIAGNNIGTLCVIDMETTHYSADALHALRDLADCVENEFNQQRLIELTHTLSEKKAALKHSLDSMNIYNRVLEELHTLTSDPGLSLDEKIHALLMLGRHTFDLPLAIISHIDGDTYTVKYSSAPVDAPPPDTRFNLGETYCSHTLSADKPTGFHHAGNSTIANHPCYQQFGLESYIGTPLQVSGKRYGTLNFSSPEPKNTAFTEQDFTLLQLIGQWVSVEIERANTTSELLAAKDTAEAHNRAKSEFLNVMSHELRTPLTVILGYLPLLKKEKTIPPPALLMNIAKDMETAGQQLMAMINDLLDISKIEAGKLTLCPEAVNIKQLAQSIIDSYKVLAEQKNIELILQINAEEIVGDPVRIKQILYNLVSNAWKFTPQGSITIHTQAIDNGIRCQVIDSGLGISAQEREKIFDKFHQVDSSSTRNSGGTGLGLAITQKLVALHGGTINVDSIEGKGSTFTFTLINQREKARG